MIYFLSPFVLDIRVCVCVCDTSCHICYQWHSMFSEMRYETLGAP